MGIISLLGVLFNGGISTLLNLDEIKSFSNLAFINIDNKLIYSLFNLIDVFFIAQIYILALFLKNIVGYSRKTTFFIVLIHTSIMYIFQLFI